jgi:hypothetical protein
MVAWSSLVVQEYEYLVKTNSVAPMGLSAFQVLPSFLVDRLQWKENFTVVASQLTTTSTSGPKPPLWFDIYALQMMFSQHEHPAFFSPVYGCLIQRPDPLLQAPPLLRVQWFPGGLRDYEPKDYPSSFTVVPILALNAVTFGLLSHSGGNDSHLDICQELIDFDPDLLKNVNSFSRQPILGVIGGDGTGVPATWVAGYCEFKALCVHHGSKTPASL